MASASVAAPLAAGLVHQPDQRAPPDAAADVDEVALEMQIAEVSSALNALVAQRLALEDAQGWQGTAGSQEIAAMEEEEAVLCLELQELQAQAGFLQARMAQAATDQHHLQQTRDVQLARQVAEYDRIAEHDRRFAQKLARMDDREWERVGDRMQEPLHPPPDISRKRAASPTWDRPDSSKRRVAAGGGQVPAGAAGSAGTEHAADVIVLDGAGTAAGAATPSSTAAAEVPGMAVGAAPGGAGGCEGQVKGKGKEAADVVDMTKDTTLWGALSQQHRCNICFEDHALGSMLCANQPADQPSSSSSCDSGCGHYYCRGCMQQYATVQVQERQYPVACPSQGCRGLLDHDHLVALLDTLEDLRALQEVETIHALGPGQILYCPHKDCSALLSRADVLAPNQPTHCPVCRNVFCPTCRSTGWHEGFTCEAFQALPAHQRSAEDAALLSLSAASKWRPCPACQMLVERTYGCNHMRCRCGADFCYTCGKQYTDNKPTANNVHGTPACRCNLFDVPREDPPPLAVPPPVLPVLPAPVPAAVPVVPAQPPPVPIVHQPPAVRQQKAGRRMVGRRPVSKARCRNAQSINDCPRGHRCWFSHLEDL